MIVTVTLNPALDLTYAVAEFVPHGTHRVTTVHERPGGKGLNVARVLHQLGEPVLATGLLGGLTGRRLTELLTAEGVPSSFVEITGETRRTVAVVDPQDATGFWEPGPPITPAEWATFVAHFRSLLPGADVVTLSGSLPPGLPPIAYADLLALARQAGVRAILDTSGPALAAGLTARPAVVKPNTDELFALAGPSPNADPGDEELVAAISGLGADAVVLSRGEQGLLAAIGSETWTATPPERVDGNPTGAGDACVAALARGLRNSDPWPEILADALALSAAAVAAPIAGSFDADLYQRFRPTATVTRRPDVPAHRPQPAHEPPAARRGDGRPTHAADPVAAKPVAPAPGPATADANGAQQASTPASPAPGMAAADGNGARQAASTSVASTPGVPAADENGGRPAAPAVQGSTTQGGSCVRTHR
jgi:tagatose 6-phosphate kinase